MLIPEKERKYQRLLKHLGLKVGKETLRLEGEKQDQLKRIDRLIKRASREVNRPI